MNEWVSHLPGVSEQMRRLWVGKYNTQLTQVQTKNDGIKRGWLCWQAGKADATISL